MSDEQPTQPQSPTGKALMAPKSPIAIVLACLAAVAGVMSGTDLGLPDPVHQIAAAVFGILASLGLVSAGARSK